MLRTKPIHISNLGSLPDMRPMSPMAGARISSDSAQDDPKSVYSEARRKMADRGDLNKGSHSRRWYWRGNKSTFDLGADNLLSNSDLRAPIFIFPPHLAARFATHISQPCSRCDASFPTEGPRAGTCRPARHWRPGHSTNPAYRVFHVRPSLPTISQSRPCMKIIPRH